jgi:hypothetical protein
MPTINVEELEMELEVQVGENLPPTHSVRILWGSESHQEMMKDIDPVCEYRFATKAELEAFMVGVDSAEGYLGYAIVDDNG